LSQAVLAAYCEDVGIDMKTALMIASPFGGGIGRLREVCGAASAMFMIAGLKYGYVDPKDMNAKRSIMSWSKNLWKGLRKRTVL